MTALPPEVRRAAEPVGVGGFEIGYVTDDGLEHRVSLSQAWATPFESCSPIRRFTSHKGQRHLSGLWSVPGLRVTSSAVRATRTVTFGRAPSAPMGTAITRGGVGLCVRPNRYALARGFGVGVA